MATATATCALATRPLGHAPEDGLGLGPAQEVEPENHPEHESATSSAPHGDGSPQPSSPRGLRLLLRFKREARFGIAALLSFLILVSVLILKKGKDVPRAGRLAPLAKIDNPGSPSRASTHPATQEGPPDHGKEHGPDAPDTPPPPPPLPAEPAPAPAQAQGTAPKVPDPIAEPLRLASASEPSSSQANPEAMPTEAPGKSLTLTRR